MSLQYDDIGIRYDDIKATPAAEVETATFLSALGDISGLKALDLACGTGHYSSVLLSNGAASVTGYDISPEMIKHAQTTLSEYQNVEFHVGDCTKPLPPLAEENRFDLVLAAWCLNYASNEVELLIMCQNIRSNLKTGGRFIGVLPNLELDMTEPLDQRYGVTVRAIDNVKDGWKCKLTALTEPLMEFQTYHLRKDVYLRCFEKAGLKELRVADLALPNDQRQNSRYWDEYLRRPHIQVTTAIV